MSKVKSAYFCRNCGHQSPKWLGKCPSCNEWNTFDEEILQKPGDEKVFSHTTSRVSKPQSVAEISLVEENRVLLPDNELNRVLGGGLVPGSLILFGGEPGI